MRFTYSVPGFVLHIYPWAARWALEINGEVFGSYFSAAQAADDAGCQVTGDSFYDTSPFAASGDLGDWRRE